MTNWSEKVALVTGGRSGIGAAISAKLASLGVTVVTAQRGEDRVHPYVSANFLNPSEPERVIHDVIKMAGGLDILVNNAGIMREGTVLETSDVDWAETLHVNLTVPFMLIKHALPHLTKRRGSIVNIGSIEGLGSNPRHPAYCASKGGIHALTRAVAVDHGGDGVRCNAIAPGWIDTDLNTAFIESLGDPESFKASLGDIHPVGRTGTPGEIAGLAAWLASDEASFVTGQVWTVDGGRTSKLSLP
ncbi:SDR family NAD(P)-dependent oxidoreductase [Ruegeria arenilitoris]|uniref:SDR family NAD(P)-dependent oxidoreductase n=1 Tax=Ruegeria arenilitoris TaxID=1173585 RepID=UPI00147BA8B2|nr:SDR family oxidoreductase [Ruegeria arenilitoris]